MTIGPTTAPPRDPPRWWTAAPVAPADRRRVATEVVAVLTLIAMPGFLSGLSGIGDPRSIDLGAVGALDLLASVAGSAGGAMLAAHLLWRDGLLQVAGFHRRPVGFVVGYGVVGTVACYVALVAGVVAGAGVYAAFGGDLQALYDEVDSTTSNDGRPIVLLAVGVVIAITAGITEEIVFRAYAVTRLEQLGWGRWGAIGAAVLFTSLHLYQGVIALFGIGGVTVALMVLYKWKRTLLPLMVAHALYNTLQFSIAVLR